MKAVLGDNIHAFHVNHMLRGEEADADELFCQNFCKEQGISFSSVKLDVAAASNRSAVEETARNMRYLAFAKECERIGAKKIALAHTASDNAETVVFNLSRGTALAGLRGIPPKRAHGNCEIIRPLMLCTRADIEGYAEENGLPYRTDSTNTDVHYRRNFVRHRIIPFMKEINPSLEERIIATSDSLRADEDFIRQHANDFLSENAEEDGVSVQKLALLHKAVRTRVYAAMYARECEKNLEEKHFSDIDGLLSSDKKNARVILPGKIAATVMGGNLRFMNDEIFVEKNCRSEFTERVPYGICDFAGKFSTVLVRCDDPYINEGIDILSKRAIFKASVLLPESVADTLQIRNRQNGDKYSYGGMTRTLKKLLSGASESAKTIRPVFCDDKGIFWFPAFRVRDDVYYAKEKTYILHYFEY